MNSTEDQQKKFLEFLLERGQRFSSYEERASFNKTAYEKMGFRTPFPTSLTKNISRSFKLIMKNQKMGWMQGNEKYSKIFDQVHKIYSLENSKNQKKHPKQAFKAIARRMPIKKTTEEISDKIDNPTPKNSTAAIAKKAQKISANKTANPHEPDAHDALLKAQRETNLKLDEIKKLLQSLSDGLLKNEHNRSRKRK